MQLSDNGGNTVSSMREYAKSAAEQIGWSSDLVYAQWSLETGNFTSHVFLVDHNLAGIKWVSARNNPGATGPGVKASDGGYYAHYPNLSAGVQGYVNFIKANKRYANVKTGKTLRDQATLLRADGWATDPDYVSKVLKISGGNQDVSVNDVANVSSGLPVDNSGVSDKLKSIVSSPVFWVVLLVGLVFKA